MCLIFWSRPPKTHSHTHALKAGHWRLNRTKHIIMHIWCFSRNSSKIIQKRLSRKAKPKCWAQVSNSWTCNLTKGGRHDFHPVPASFLDENTPCKNKTSNTPMSETSLLRYLHVCFFVRGLVKTLRMANFLLLCPALAHNQVVKVRADVDPAIDLVTMPWATSWLIKEQMLRFCHIQEVVRDWETQRASHLAHSKVYESELNLWDSAESGHWERQAPLAVHGVAFLGTTSMLVPSSASACSEASRPKQRGRLFRSSFTLWSTRTFFPPEPCVTPTELSRIQSVMALRLISKFPDPRAWFVGPKF